MNDDQKKQLTKNIELIGRKVLIDVKNLKETGLEVEFKETNELRTDPFLAALTMLNHFFMRGRNDELSNKYFKITRSALNKLKDENYSGDFLQVIKVVDEGLKNDVRDFFQKQSTKNTLNSDRRGDFSRLFEHTTLISGLLNETIADKKLNNDVDFQMIIGALSFINKHKEKNVTNYCLKQIEDNKTAELFCELKDIYGVGDKLASFYLRNLAALFFPEKEFQKDEMKYYLPIDTWIVQVLKHFKNAEKGYKNVSYNPDEAKNDMINLIQEYSLNPIAFNQGCWYVGYHSFDLIVDCLSKNSHEFTLPIKTNSHE